MCILVWSTSTYKAKRDQLSVEEIVGTDETSIQGRKYRLFHSIFLYLEVKFDC